MYGRRAVVHSGFRDLGKLALDEEGDLGFELVV